MRLLARLARGAGVAAIVTAAFVAVPTIADASTPVVGHVYVNDNTAGTNTIGAFDQHADGSLTPAAGSPFAAGGAGTGTVIGSQGSIQATADGDWVLAVDAGSNQISVLGRRERRLLDAGRRQPRLIGRDRAGQHRGARRSGLRGQRGERHDRQQLHRVQARRRRTPHAARRTRRSRCLRPPFPATSCSTARART